MRTLQEIKDEILLNDPEITQDDLDSMAQSQYERELEIYNIEQEIATSRSQLDSDLLTEVLLWDSENPIIKASGKVLTLWKRENKLREWAANSLKSKSEQEILNNRKVWANAHDFLNELTMEEQTALATSPYIAGLALQLSTWQGDVWSDDPRIIEGLNACVNAGVITAERKEEIVSK